MILLTVALFVDAAMNIGRMIVAERGMRYQRKFLENRDNELAAVIDAICEKGEA